MVEPVSVDPLVVDPLSVDSVSIEPVVVSVDSGSAVVSEDVAVAVVEPVDADVGAGAAALESVDFESLLQPATTTIASVANMATQRRLIIRRLYGRRWSWRDLGRGGAPIP
jgi:hypothetical protein